MLVVRTRAIIGTKIDTGEHHLGKPRFLDVAHLFEHSVDGHGALRAARLPHDAVRAAVVATVLDLYAHARLPERKLRWLTIAPCALLKPEELEGARDDLDLRGNDRDPIGEVSKRLWMQRRGATGSHHERLAGTPQGMADRLAGLRLGLPRHRAGVDNDKLGIVWIDEREACLRKIALHAIGFNSIDPAPQVDDGYERIGHSAPYASGAYWSRISSMASRMRSPIERRAV